MFYPIFNYIFSAVIFGEKNDKCADALLLYGRCLLELGRAENCVLGNALKGWSQIEYDSQEEISTDQFEDPEKVTEAERVKLRDEVTNAMAEPDTIEEEGQEKATGEKSESMETEEKQAEDKKEVAEPPSTDKMDEDKPAETKVKYIKFIL